MRGEQHVVTFFEACHNLRCAFAEFLRALADALEQP